MAVPDEGWSWVVALAAWFCSLVLAGIFRTFGVLYVAFIDVYGVSREEAAWPMGVCIAVLNLTGPFAGLLGQKYGVRPVVIAGAVIGAIGMSACFFTSSLTVITVLLGGVFGFGHGLVNTLLPVIVNVYFLRLRSTANGIAYSGSCIGSMLLPLLFEACIREFGLSGCFLLTGGIVLNVAVAGALLRPFQQRQAIRGQHTTSIGPSLLGDGPRSGARFEPALKNEFGSLRDDTQVLVQSSGRMSEGQKDGGFRPLDPQLGPQRQQLQAELVNALNQRTFLTSTSVIEESFESSLNTSASSVFDAADRLQQADLPLVPQQFEDTLHTTSKSEEVLNEVKTSDLTDSCPARHSFSVSSSAKRDRFNKSQQLPNSGPLRKYKFRLRHPSGDSDLCPVSENACIDSNDARSDTVDHQRRVVDVTAGHHSDAIHPNSDTTSQDKLTSFAGSFSRVLCSGMFYVTACTNVTFYFLFHMYLVIVVDYALDEGVPEGDTKYILFAFAIADLVGRLGFGWVTDRGLLTRSRFVALGMAGIGLVFFAFPFANRYWALLTVSGFYGLLLGCTMVLFPVLLVEYLGQEVHGVAYGCMCFLNGFTSFLRPMIIGYFRDNIGSYHTIFFILGTISLASSTLWFLEKCLHPKTPLKTEPTLKENI